MEVELEQASLFLVHLSLKYSHRHHQMHHLLSLVKSRPEACDRGWGFQHTVRATMR